ncbi:carboxylesterase BioH (pimeloyl-CoA synthesis) [Nitrosomonas cryotolerans]|uniref:Pimeloyl-[acyl-carrier protein] methyl ester esterase n=1 Tax=Nitrosomonas cryotolerans ATCC 49181 TaxID=1131553 RepID=A0A1N6HM66_9PROT|nr:pimeloyl-ACP methyl ester esterase BioH [Nitrosomonas cryotolerans]SFQ05509.1 carboxylesterase BioH (pimeloyl-CoA synthesis) [Nitrosomonas cryotolerans]SIO20833.1 carboxylesterase BioH (pimeloyl-CoA synthesis) [Nitrosomonas cryotolerans ATCC 49181]
MSKIHVESLGQGPDLVLLHGWAMHGGIWGGVRDRLAACYRLHLVDLPGHGFSPVGEFGTLEHIVELVTAVLPENGIVCGWSLGGQIAIELALREPLRVKALALVATTPCFVNRVDWQWGMDKKILQLFMENLVQNYAATINRFLTLQVSGEVDVTATLAQLRKNFFRRNQPDHEALQQGLEILLTSDLREKLTAITQPVLLLHGENDVVTSPAAARWMHAQLPDSKLVMLPHCGHAPFLSYPEQFITSLYELRSHFR